jgi:serine/threonine protein kinase
LRKEGANLTRLGEILHPNILRLHQVGKVQVQWNNVREDRYFVTVAYGGVSLRAKLGPLRVEIDADGDTIYAGSGRRLDVNEALDIAIAVCKGLEAAHAFTSAAIRIIHRDISPNNILIDDDTGVARLSDLGITRVIERTSAIASHPAKLVYMDPQCFWGKTTVQSDLYSVGVVLYEMLTGELPFATFEQRLEAPPRPPHTIVPELPAALSRIVLRCLDNTVEARYADASELLRDLRRLYAAINPLPTRYVKLTDLDDGRWLCEDLERDERVAIRLAEVDVPRAELGRVCDQLNSASVPAIEPPLDHFQHEQMAGLVARVPRDAALNERFRDLSPDDPVRMQELCTIMAGVCDALTKAHELGIRHGYLAPCSIRLGPEGTRIQELGSSVLLSRAQHAADFMNQAQWRLHRPYVSPQLMTSKADPQPADDVFSVGAILYDLLVGYPPFELGDREHKWTAESPQAARYPQAVKPLIPAPLATIVAQAVSWHAGDRPASVAELADVLRCCRWPDDVADALCLLAMQTYPAGSTDAELITACQLIDRALRLCPGSAKAHFARGVVYFRNGAYAFAIKELDRAARIAPNRDVLDLLGQCYSRCDGQYREAVRVFRAALEHGEDAVVLEHLALALKGLGKDDSAIERLRRSIELELDQATLDRRRHLLQQWESQGMTRTH